MGGSGSFGLLRGKSVRPRPLLLLSVRQRATWGRGVKTGVSQMFCPLDRFLLLGSEASPRQRAQWNQRVKGLPLGGLTSPRQAFT